MADDETPQVVILPASEAVPETRGEAKADRARIQVTLSQKILTWGIASVFSSAVSVTVAWQTMKSNQRLAEWRIAQLEEHEKAQGESAVRMWGMIQKLQERR